MRSTPDWGRLYEQGRCKSIGVPWNEQELSAVHKLKIPVDYVRQGCITLEQFKKMQTAVESKSEKPLKFLKRDDLLKKAVALGIVFDENVVNREDLISLIQANSEKQARLIQESKLPERLGSVLES